MFAASLPRHVVSATVLVTDTDGQVLMLHQARPYPGRPPWWQLPAGLADLGEAPPATALRELAEETGLRPGGVLRSLAVDYRSPADEWLPVIDFAFAADPISAGTPVQLSGEYDAFAWRTWEQWESFLQPEQQAWFAALHAAHRLGRTVVLVDGQDAGGAAEVSVLLPIRLGG
ncbi:NUDIX hydrolase [Kitasatospora cineracea]